MSSILITGANGFVGTHLIRHLAKNASRRILAASRQHRSLPKNVVPRQAPDISETTEWPSLSESVDTVIHLASRAHVMGENHKTSLAAYRQVNVEGTRALFQAAAENDLRHFIYLSSIKAVGESSSPGDPLSEESPTLPEDPYGQSKREAEQLLAEECAKANIRYTIIRPPLMYGEGMKGNLPALARLARKSLPLPFGSLNRNRRSLLSIENLVSFIETLLDHPHSRSEILHLADPEPVSTRELVELLATAQNHHPRLWPCPPVILRCGLTLLGKGGMARRLTESLELSTDKARKIFSWTPPHSTRESLPKAIG